MATKRDFYEVLGLSKNASKDEIKAAYRKLAKQYHPDVNKEPGAEAKFKEVSEAYEVLYDDQKRATYDQFGMAAFEQGAGGQAQNPFQGFGGQSSFQDVDLGDLFGSFFGGGTRRSRTPTGPQRGPDSFMRVKISFMDSIMGKKVKIPVTYDEPCQHCGGTGARSSSDIETCPTCHGSGRVRTRQQTILGTYESESVCPRCHGSGKVINHECDSCGGAGYTRVKASIEVSIPAGINEGQQIRVSGKGERGANGGPNGDLFLEMAIDKHQYFTRDGNDIHIEIPISIIDAALGTTIDVPTVYGDVTVRIPAGTQPGQILKIRGKGVHDLRGNDSGDQFVHLNVQVPTKLSKDQRDLLERYKNNEPKGDSVWEKFKNSFRN